MQSPRPRNISIALIVFVLTPSGDVDTIAVAPTDLDDLLERSSAAQGSVAVTSSLGGGRLSDQLRDAIRSRLPSVVLPARMRPLTPRILRDGAICIPLWTTGRPVDAGAVGSDGGLANLSRAIGDPTLTSEAKTEFRRMLASDPMAHQMVGEATRARALAADEALREPSPDEVPPIFALLPMVFTIDQLRVAASQLVVAAGSEIERPSNFRRRVSEFIESGVVVDCGDAVGASHRGRPPRLYRFDPAGWQEWLFRRSQPHRSDDASIRSDQVFREVGIAEFIRPERRDLPSPSTDPRVSRDDAPYGWPSELNPPARASAKGSPPTSRKLLEVARRDESPREPRVDELERQVERLSGEVQAGREQMSELLRMLGAELRARRSGDEEPRR